MQLLQEAGNLVGCVLQIGVEEDQPARGRRLRTGHERLGLSEVPPMADHAKPIPAAGLVPEPRGRAIGGPIVDQHDLALQSVSLERGAQLAHQVRRVVGLVVGGNDDGEVATGVRRKLRLTHHRLWLQDRRHGCGTPAPPRLHPLAHARRQHA